MSMSCRSATDRPSLAQKDPLRGLSKLTKPVLTPVPGTRTRTLLQWKYIEQGEPTLQRVACGPEPKLFVLVQIKIQEREAENSKLHKPDNLLQHMKEAFSSFVFWCPACSLAG